MVRFSINESIIVDFFSILIAFDTNYEDAQEVATNHFFFFKSVYQYDCNRNERNFENKKAVRSIEAFVCIFSNRFYNELK